MKSAHTPFLLERELFIRTTRERGRAHVRERDRGGGRANPRVKSAHTPFLFTMSAATFRDMGLGSRV